MSSIEVSGITTPTEKAELPKEKIDVEHLETSSLDYDAQRLQELGYKQEFKREISLFVQAGFSFSTMAILPSWLVGFGGSISAGGPSSLFWGWVTVVPFVFCVSLCMSEIISAYPVAGGVYSWSYLLSNKEWGPFMSWINGYSYLIGLLAVDITLAWTSAEFIFYMANIMNFTQITQQGAYVGLYIGLIILGSLYTTLGVKFSAYLNKFMVIWAAIGTIIVVCVCPAMAPTHPSAKWVFTEFKNNTGYDNNGLVFLLGLLQAGWALIGYECGAQIVEGTKRADITAPRGIIICVLSAIFQGFILIISVLFSIQDVEELLNSDMPIATYFVRATNTPLAVFFLVILLVTSLGSLCNSLLASAQILWAMARDGCVPFSKHLYKLSEKNRIPYNALFWQAVICVIIILPSLGSTVYWSAIMSVAVAGVNISYGLPFLCRLIWSRNTMKKGPFDLGRLSIPLNVISVCWVTFFGIILCFPGVNPVAPDTMNWAALMIGGVLLFSLAFWFISGRKNFKGPVQTAD